MNSSALLESFESRFDPMLLPDDDKENSPGAESFDEVIFQLDSKSAREVLLLGDFTDWEKAPIKLNHDGTAWYATVPLAPGRYHYRFLVDGRWQNDPSCPTCSPNPFGTWNNIIEI